MRNGSAAARTVFAEHAPPCLAVHEGHFTTDFDPACRYAVEEWRTGRVSEGESLVTGDRRGHPVYGDPTLLAGPMTKIGLQSALLVPLSRRGRVIALLGPSSTTPDLYGDGTKRWPATGICARSVGPSST